MQHNNDPVSLTQFLAQLCENQWAISEFQKLSLSKRGAKRSGKPLLTENEFCLHENKIFFPINGFALSLALKQSLEGTGKWHMKAIVSPSHSAIRPNAD